MTFSVPNLNYKAMDAKIMELDTLSIDGEPEEHNFIKGAWKPNGRYRYETRMDVCSKCLCERHLVRSKHTDNEELISSYWRSKQSFPHDNPPLCWGKPNP